MTSRRAVATVSKTALAAAAFGVFAFASAQPVRAADLLTTKAPATYVKQCTAEGDGFYYIPGTDTCLRIGGYVWMEGYYNSYSHYPATNNDLYSISTGALIMDARTSTEYGTLRSYMETRLKWRTSDPWSDGPNGTELEVWNIFVQFAGLTAGHAQSFFDFYANANVLGTDPATIGDDTRINLIAYTAEFGNGFSATLSVEDGQGRTSGIFSANPPAGSMGADYTEYQAGAQVPDFVGNLKVEQSWGSAQLSGALHQVRSLDYFLATDAGDTWGFAIQGGIMFNLPMLGEGDTLYLQSAYVDGATSYLGLVDASGEYIAPDAFTGPWGVSKVSGWNVTASLLHNWNAKWSTAVFGGYAAYDFNDSLAEAFYGASGGENGNVGGYVGFTPVKNLMIALQYDWNYNKAKNYVAAAYSPTQASTNANQLMLFISRDF